MVSTFRASLALGALPPVRGDVRQEVKAETRARRMDGRLAFGAPKVKTDTTWLQRILERFTFLK